MTVNFGDLIEVDQACPTVHGSTYPIQPVSAWQEWKLNAGKLVAVDKPYNTETPTIKINDLKVSDLPKDYQVILSSEPQNKPAAFTFSVPNTGPVLGIVEKNKM
jgi:hypothetical protein